MPHVHIQQQQQQHQQQQQLDAEFSYGPTTDVTQAATLHAHPVVSSGGMASNVEVSVTLSSLMLSFFVDSIMNFTVAICMVIIISLTACQIFDSARHDQDVVITMGGAGAPVSL